MKIIDNIKNIILINVILIFTYIWAYFGVVFNDTGTYYNNVLDALPKILFGVLPFAIGSVLLGILFYKKKKINVILYSFIQIIICVLLVIYYIDNYVH